MVCGSKMSDDIGFISRFSTFSNSISMYVTKAGMQGTAKITEP